MHITLHMAISVDGFIAKLDGDSDWVSPLDERLFERRCREAGCLVLGRRTYDQYYGKIYPVAGADNIVMTHKPGKAEAGVAFVSTPREAIAKAESLGHDKILLAGGSKIAASFLKENLIDEIFLSVHPIVLGQGIKLFGDAASGCELALVDSAPLGEGLVQLHYKKKP